MKPKCKPTNDKLSCLAWICIGHKNGAYHVVFGGSWWEACRRWYESEPKCRITDDIPF